MSIIKTIVFCTLVCLLVVCPAQALEMTLNDQNPTLQVSETPCETCMAVVQDAEDYISKPSTQDVVVTFIQDNVCVLLPTNSSRTCHQEAPVLVAQAVASIEQKLAPDTVCSYIGTCGKGAFWTKLAQTSGLNSLQADGFFVECPLCKLVMSNALQRLKDPESRAEIYETALKACEDMAEPELITKCQSDVQQLFSSVDDLLRDVDASRACQVLQFCPNDQGVMRQTPAGVAVLQQLQTRLSELKRTGDDENCEACKSVISEAVAVLMNPDIQKEVKDFVKQGCDAFDEYKDACIEYVDQYAPMAFGMLIAYLQPDQFCSRLGYCGETRTI